MAYSPPNAAFAPIGIFDSGIGGLSVLRHIREHLPLESLHYFADSGFAPYGEKSEHEVLERAHIAVKHFIQEGVKAIVIACNAATAVAGHFIRTHYPDLILVGVEPGLKPAATLSKTGCVGVLTTERTLRSNKYQTLCQRIEESTHVRFIHQACPGLALQIENGEFESERTLLLLRDYLQPILATDADVIVLGCTHYPFVSDSIRQVLNEAGKSAIQLIDTGAAIAQQLRAQLDQHQLCRRQPSSPPGMQFTTSGDPQQLTLVLKQLPQLAEHAVAIQQFTQKNNRLDDGEILKFA